VTDLSERILYADNQLLVIDKPAGLAVHAGPSTRESLDDFLHTLQDDFPHPPRPAHRLDRDTSGCLALARHTKQLPKLAKLFEDGQVVKTYAAVVQVLADLPDEGTIDRLLYKVSSAEAGWSMTALAPGDTPPHGAKVQTAVTHYRVQNRWETADGPCALLELRPETGRTHQLRVHLAAVGAPILHDPVYGPARDWSAHPRTDGPPLLLHASSLTIPWKPGAAPIRIEAPLPDRFPSAPPHGSTSLP